MADDTDSGVPDLSLDLKKYLNTHGFAFQYRALRECLDADGDQRWKLAVYEYPISLNGSEGSIDFVLASGTHVIVAECKRSKTGVWAFARSGPFPRYRARPCADFLSYEGDKIVRDIRLFGNQESPYDFGSAIREKSQSEFDKAISQVMRARGGIMEDIASRRLRYGGGAVVPVILTTATLVATDTDLSSADLSSGELAKLDARERPWVWFDYNLSKSLRPSVEPERWAPSQVPPTKSQLLQLTLNRDSRRSIAIVNWKGIRPFLNDLPSSLDAADDPMNLYTGH